MAVVTATGLLYQLLEEETKRTGDDAERNRDEGVRRGAWLNTLVCILLTETLNLIQHLFQPRLLQFESGLRVSVSKCNCIVEGKRAAHPVK